MTIRSRTFLACCAASALLCSTATATAQSSSGTASPRTADGQPDLTGVWDFRTVTPLERPAELADKAFLTGEEVAAYAAEKVRASNADLDREAKKQETTERRPLNGTSETAALAPAYNDLPS